MCVCARARVIHTYIHYIHQEPIRGGACNATVGWVESLLENDVAYGCGKSIHSNFHSPYKESKDSRYIRWLWLYEQVSSRHRASSKRNLLLQSLVVPGFKRGSPSFRLVSPHGRAVRSLLGSCMQLCPGVVFNFL